MKKPTHITCCNLLFCAVISILVVTGTRADSAPNPSETNAWERASEEELTDIIGKTAIQINELMRKASETRETIEFAWSNPSFTTKAISTKRQAFKQAEAAFIQARIELQEEVNRLPEIQQLTKENEALKATIETLQKNNAVLLKLLRVRRTTMPAND